LPNFVEVIIILPIEETFIRPLEEEDEDKDIMELVKIIDKINFRGQGQFGRVQFRRGQFRGRFNNQNQFQFPQTNNRSNNNYQRSFTNNTSTY